MGNLKSFYTTHLTNTLQSKQSEQSRSKLPAEPILTANPQVTDSTESNSSSLTLESSTSQTSPLSDSGPTNKVPAAALQTLKDSPAALSDSSSANKERVAVCLPKLSIPVFGGDPLDWQPFWASFEAAVHNNSQLSDAQKLSYLHAQLCGDASQVSAGLLLTSPSYSAGSHKLTYEPVFITLWYLS